MDFKEVAAVFLMAVIVGVGIWATIGSPPPEHTSVMTRRQVAGPP